MNKGTCVKAVSYRCKRGLGFTFTVCGCFYLSMSSGPHRPDQIVPSPSPTTVLAQILDQLSVSPTTWIVIYYPVPIPSYHIYIIREVDSL